MEDFTAIKDVNGYGWRVEFIDANATYSEGDAGMCYVATFTGGDDERRARNYAAWMNVSINPNRSQRSLHHQHRSVA